MNVPLPVFLRLRFRAIDQTGVRPAARRQRCSPTGAARLRCPCLDGVSVPISKELVLKMAEYLFGGDGVQVATLALFVVYLGSVGRIWAAADIYLGSLGPLPHDTV